MTLLELSAAYGRSAKTLHRRIAALRAQARQSPDPAEARRRIAALLPLWQEARTLTDQTAHYYDWRRRHEHHQP